MLEIIASNWLRDHFEIQWMIARLTQSTHMVGLYMKLMQNNVSPFSRSRTPTVFSVCSLHF